MYIRFRKCTYDVRRLSRDAKCAFSNSDCCLVPNIPNAKCLFRKTRTKVIIEISKLRFNEIIKKKSPDYVNHFFLFEIEKLVVDMKIFVMYV